MHLGNAFRTYDFIDLIIFYCTFTYTKGWGTSSYNFRGSYHKYNCHSTKYHKKIRQLHR